MKRYLFLFFSAFLIFCVFYSRGQSFYWVSFTDKNQSPEVLSTPGEYLSERAIQRREKQNIAIDSLDLPVSPNYKKQVLQQGATLIHSSKWLNGITVKAESEHFGEQVRALPFVDEVQLTKKTGDLKSIVRKFVKPNAFFQFADIDSTFYGASAHQVGQTNLQFLHKQGFRGEGMHIAVLDAGFFKADEYPAFDYLWTNNQVLGAKDFTTQDENIFIGHYHGMSVLSVMGGYIPGQLIGTAPGASYWLLRTEDTYSEFLIEEDNWVAAAEFADSAGADIINSSLGYFLFNDPSMNHTYADMDGKTTRVTKAANIAASKGMLVFSSAGNEGNKNSLWRYIIAPSDGDGVMAVGAVNQEGTPAPFTSFGPAYDGDIKPNVTALGWNTIIQRKNGTIGTGNGTSYSTPVMTGTAACLWQANPHASAWEVKRAIEQSAHLFNNPDSLRGFGIPDMRIADQILKMPLLEQWQNENDWLAYPNPVNTYLILQKKTGSFLKNVEIEFYSLEGRLLLKRIKPNAPRILVNNLNALPPGILILQIISDENTEALLIYKSP